MNLVGLPREDSRGSSESFLLQLEGAFTATTSPSLFKYSLFAASFYLNSDSSFSGLSVVVMMNSLKVSSAFLMEELAREDILSFSEVSC